MPKKKKKEITVDEHKQRYHTKKGVKWISKESYNKSQAMNVFTKEELEKLHASRGAKAKAIDVSRTAKTVLTPPVMTMSKRVDLSRLDIEGLDTKKIKKYQKQFEKAKIKVNRSKSIAKGKELYSEKYNPRKTHLSSTKTMTDLQKRQLIKICLNNDVDIQVLDSHLKYDENKKIVEKFIKNKHRAPDDLEKYWAKLDSKFQNLPIDSKKEDLQHTEKTLILDEDIKEGKKLKELLTWQKSPLDSKIDVEGIDTGAKYNPETHRLKLKEQKQKIVHSNKSRPLDSLRYHTRRYSLYQYEHMKKEAEFDLKVKLMLKEIDANRDEVEYKRRKFCKPQEKMPYEMTKKEWNDYRSSMKSNYADQSAKAHGKAANEAVRRVKELERLNYEVEKGIDRDIGILEPVYWEDVIEKAMLEGILIPKHVERDYKNKTRKKS